VRLLTELAENGRECSKIKPSKMDVGLCLILLPFQSYGLLVEGSVGIENIKTGVEKNQTTSGKS